MMRLSKKVMTAAAAHAEAEYPRESCGLIVARGRALSYWPCKNLSATPAEHFIMDPLDLAAAEDVATVVAVVHSHPDAPSTPSAADRKMCEGYGVGGGQPLPWLIFEVREGRAVGSTYFEPSGYEAPLLNRPFFHGVLDCYALVQDVYAREFDIVLPYFDRTDGWWMGDNAPELYLDNVQACGFSLVRDTDPMQPGDLVLMQLRSLRANHAGVFLGDRRLKECPGLFPVPDCMIHHCYGHLSERVTYGGYWRDITRAVYRHEALK